MRAGNTTLPVFLVPQEVYSGGITCHMSEFGLGRMVGSKKSD